MLCRDRSDANVTRFIGYCQSPARKRQCFDGVWMKLALRSPAAAVEAVGREPRRYRDYFSTWTAPLAGFPAALAGETLGCGGADQERRRTQALSRSTQENALQVVV